MTINERIRAFHKECLKISQTEFALKLGITQGGLSYLEKAGSPVTESTIKLICTTFGLSEEWLRTGKGEMYAGKTPEQAFEDYLIEHQLDQTSIRLVKAFIELSPDVRKSAVDHLKFIFGKDDRE